MGDKHGVNQFDAFLLSARLAGFQPALQAAAPAARPRLAMSEAGDAGDAADAGLAVAGLGGDHSAPAVRLCEIIRPASGGSCGFHLSRTKWDPYPWVGVVEDGSAAQRAGLQVRKKGLSSILVHGRYTRPFDECARATRAHLILVAMESEGVSPIQLRGRYAFFMAGRMQILPCCTHTSLCPAVWQVGDCVLEVNGEDVVGQKISEIADRVRSRPDAASLLVWNCGSDGDCDPEVGTSLLARRKMFSRTHVTRDGA